MSSEFNGGLNENTNNVMNMKGNKLSIKCELIIYAHVTLYINLL